MHHGFSVGVVDDQTILVLLVISGRGHFLAIRQPDAITGRRLRTFQWGWGQTACTSNIIQATAVTKIPQNFALAGVADTVDMLGEALHSQDRVANASYGPAGSTRPPPHLQRPAPVRSGPVSRTPPHLQRPAPVHSGPVPGHRPTYRDRHQSAAARYPDTERWQRSLENQTPVQATEANTGGTLTLHGLCVSLQTTRAPVVHPALTGL